MKKSILGIVFISFLVTGCSPIFYTPNTQNVPMISKKGDNKIVVAGNTNQVELQGAYGLSDAFAIQDFLFQETWIMETVVRVISLKLVEVILSQ